jgi:hypothetical protein
LLALDIADHVSAPGAETSGLSLVSDGSGPREEKLAIDSVQGCPGTVQILLGFKPFCSKLDFVLSEAPTERTFFAVAGEPTLPPPCPPLFPAATRIRKS